MALVIWVMEGIPKHKGPFGWTAEAENEMKFYCTIYFFVYSWLGKWNESFL